MRSIEALTNRFLGSRPAATMSTPTPLARECSNCKKAEAGNPEPLKICSRCKGARYCSTECQKSDWKSHKQQCGTSSQGKQTPPKTGPKPIDVFQSLNDKTYLHSMSETDVYDQLTDAYRMRIEDEYVFRGDASGLYGGEDPRPGFKRFLNKAERRPGLLPSWWSKEKRKNCEKRAVDSVNWSDINSAVEKGDIQEHYKDPMMPMKLRILGAQIYGSQIM